MMHSLCSRLRAAVCAVSGLAAAACTLSIDAMVPSPVQDLSAAQSSGVLTLDLRDSAGISVEVGEAGRVLNLMVSARPESMLVLDRDIVQELDLEPVLLGMGSASVSDGDHRVAGEVRRARYRIAPGDWEQVWALDLEADIHPGFDGAISFGAIPASRFRLLINDPPPDGAEEIWVSLQYNHRTNASEAERDYDQLEFGYQIALHQEPVSANRKAVRYMRRQGRLTPVSGVAPFPRLFANVRPHVRFEVQPPMTLEGLPIRTILGEVAPDDDRVSPVADPDEDVIEVFHDRKTAANAPTLHLGRTFFTHCSEILVERAPQDAEQTGFAMLCRADAFTAESGATPPPG